MSNQKLLRLLSESGLDIKPKGKTQLYIEGKHIHAKTACNSIYELIEDNVPESEQIELLKYSAKASVEQGKELIEMVHHHLREERQKNNKGVIGVLSSKHSFKHIGFKPIRDIVTGEKAIFDVTNNRISHLDYETWWDSLPPDNEFRMETLREESRGVIEYNPYTLEAKTLTMVDGQEIYLFNAHIPPDWRFLDKEKPEVDPFFTKFFESFFKNEESKQYVIDWMHEAIFGRNQTALLLCGNMGNGKNTLATILGKLVGDLNYQKLNETYFKARFSGEVINKRLLLFDEVVLTKAIKEVLKDLLNDEIKVERKGKDVGRQIKNHTSIIVCNNYAHENNLVYNDRRFSVPDIVDTPLHERVSTDEINSFYQRLESDPTVILSIALYIQSNYSGNFDRNLPYKGSKFHQIRRAVLNQAESMIVERLESGEADKYKLEEIKWAYIDSNGKYWPRTRTFDAFLQNFVDDEGDKIGIVKDFEDGEYLVPTDKYNPDKEGDLYDL